MLDFPLRHALSVLPVYCQEPDEIMCFFNKKKVRQHVYLIFSNNKVNRAEQRVFRVLQSFVFIQER